MRLAKSIAADRQRLGLSQQELARLIGVSQQSISKWEEGRAVPRGKRMSNLVTALGKKSQTAEVVAGILHRDSNEPEVTVGQTSPIRPAVTQNQTQAQAQALAALAKAAADIARAAQAIADSVERMAKQQAPPPGR